MPVTLEGLRHIDWRPEKKHYGIQIYRVNSSVALML
jgi:hypothetical protein